MSERTIQDLQQLQALPLSLKVSMTKQRIRAWVNHFGESGVSVSFSGGKDSTVLLNLVREEYPNVPAVFFDTGLEYPEIRDFVRTFDNVEWIKPKKTFRKVIEDYGYPLISKEISERIYYAQKYLTWYRKKNSTENIPEEILAKFADSNEKGSYKIKELTGRMPLRNERMTQFDYSRWLFTANAPFKISNKCCDVMKKGPAHSYAKKTGRMMISGQMASESRLRTMQWLHNGCNGFDMKRPVSNPMAFWTEQDVLLYIYKNHIPIASVYGEVIKENEVDGQIDLEDLGFLNIDSPALKTTGVHRTGCMFCLFGIHMEKSPNRLERMKVTHPKQYEYIMKPESEGGLGYKEKIDWINEHGNMNIKY